jgi:hypothetical protein
MHDSFLFFLKKACMILFSLFLKSIHDSFPLEGLQTSWPPVGVGNQAHSVRNDMTLPSSRTARRRRGGQAKGATAQGVLAVAGTEHVRRRQAQAPPLLSIGQVLKSRVTKKKVLKSMVLASARTTVYTHSSMAKCVDRELFALVRKLPKASCKHGSRCRHSNTDFLPEHSSPCPSQTIFTFLPLLMVPYLIVAL